jgi:hypothetical protein
VSSFKRAISCYSIHPISCRDCDAIGSTSAHRIDQLQVQECLINPDPSANGTFYYLDPVTSATFVLYVGFPDDTCSLASTNESYVLTLDVCQASPYYGETWILSSQQCQGGFADNSDVSTNAISMIQTEDTSTCTLGLSFSISNLGITDGSCRMFDGLTYYSISASPTTGFFLLWGCNSSCDDCLLTELVRYGACSSNTLLSGSVEFVQTYLLEACFTPTTSTTTIAPSSSSSLSVGAIAGIAVGASVGAIAVILLALW